MIPPYILEDFKEKYTSGQLDWDFSKLTCLFREGLTDRTERRAMFIMMAADEPDLDTRRYWDYNDGRSGGSSFEPVIKGSPGELEGALKLCLRNFVATDDNALLVQRLEFLGNILGRHHEVFNAIIDKELVDLYMDRASPLLEGLEEDAFAENTQAVLNLYNYAFSLESKIYETAPEESKGLSGKFTSLAQGLLRYDQPHPANGYPPAAVSFAKQYLDGNHSRFFGL